ncbi:MAG: hypothetical protein GY862_06560 [Gammaproteobacteria bacterium]|nr:hypothetical protein [Gammaproteobacteria bacterium]
MVIADSNLQARANISSTTFGNGDAGQIYIAAPQVTLHRGGRVQSMAFSGSAGLGGPIEIDAENIRLSGQSVVSAQSDGSGNAGNLRISAKDTLYMDDASITTQAKHAGGGNIVVNIPARMQLADSEITARAEGLKPEDSGGNVTIKNQEFLIMDKSKILASAVGGDGGDIAIKADQFVRSGTSAVDASSELGIDGEIQINAPDMDMGAALALPAELLEMRVLLKNLCDKHPAREPSRFLITPTSRSRHTIF